MKTSITKENEAVVRTNKGLELFSAKKSYAFEPQKKPTSSIRQTNQFHDTDQPKGQSSFQVYQQFQIGQNSSFIIDYHNAKYQGKISSLMNAKTTKIIKEGPGILIDDEMNFFVSNWKNNALNGKTVLINRFGNYLYSKWNQDLLNPTGLAFIRVGSLLMLIKFSQKTGKWNMTQPQKGNTIIAIDEKNYSIVVLQGKIQQNLNQFRCSKTAPLSVVEFAHFPVDLIQQSDRKQSTQCKSGVSPKNTYQNLSKQSIQDILLSYGKKYGFNIENHQKSLSDYLQSITQDIKKNCISSKEFAIKVSKSLIQQVFSHQSNDKKPNKQNYQTYQSQQQKIYDKNGLVFRQCKNTSSNSKEKSMYFGFLNGLGIKFKEEQSDQSKGNTINKEKSFILKSMGNHNESMKIQDIGARFYENKCIEEGNFKTKSTCTYENPLFRPSNKLVSIYNKYHKQQTSFLNDYFDKNQLSIFKLLSNLQNFVNEHIVYIMNECLIETTKFHEKDEKNQLIQKLLTHSYRKTNPSPSLLVQQKSRTRPYEVQIERKSKSKTKAFAQDQRNEPLNALKNKNSQLKERIKKVKYEIEYLPPDDGNVVIMKDDKFMSKIKKHLYSNKIQGSTPRTQNKLQRNPNKSLSDRSRSKSHVVSRSKSRKNYFQKEKPKLISHPRKTNNSLNRKDYNDNSLQRVDNYLIKKINISHHKTKSKTEAELLLDKINQSIGFRQKFNYGIQFHVQNQNCTQKQKKKPSPTKNRYNGRQRFFTDNQLDGAIEHNISSSSQMSVKSITPGKKMRKKQQYRHLIYSNAGRNINNEEQKYQNQKQTQDTIRAQILGISLEEYRRKIDYQKQKQAYMEEKFLKLIEQEESILRRSSIQKVSVDFYDPNQTFGVFQQSPKLTSSKIMKTSTHKSTKGLALQETASKNQTQQAKSVFETVIYCPKPKQQSLVEKRMRILQEYKQLNGRTQEKDENDYERLRNTNFLCKNNLSPSFRQYSPSDYKNQKHFGNLPVYKDRSNKKILSPLKSMIQNRENTEIVPYGKSTYLTLQNGEKNKMSEDIRLIREQVQGYSHKNSGKQQIQRPFSTHACQNNRKYKYYFD